MKKIMLCSVCVLLTAALTACGTKDVSGLPFSLRSQTKIYEGSYSGLTSGKKPNGDGVFKFNDGDTEVMLSGTWEDGNITGIANVEHPSVDIEFQGRDYTGSYSGDVQEGKITGTGTFKLNSDEEYLKYDGEWTDGRITGKGNLRFNKMELQYNDSTFIGEYSGEVENGVPCGKGKFADRTESDFLIYEGEWKDGKFTGKGQLETDHYSILTVEKINRVGAYKGETLNGKASGQGTFHAVNDHGTAYTYTGQWENGEYNGEGRCAWESDDSFIQTGHYENGDFRPTPAQFFITKGTMEEQKYEVSEKSKIFMDKNAAVFLNHQWNEDILFEENFNYSEFSKSPEQYGEKLIKVPGLNIIQIIEDNYWGADHTFCIMEDKQYNVYYVNLYDFSDYIYEGDKVTLTALPLDYFTYPSTSGHSVWSIACAGVKLEK